MNHQFEKFSNNFKRSLKVAADLALELKHSAVEPQHILYGLISQKGSVGAEVFTSLKIKPEEIKNNITKSSQEATQTTTITQSHFSDKSKNIIEKSIKVAYINRHHYVGTEHLLAALVQSGDDKIKNIFNNIKISEQDITDKIIGVLKSVSKMPDITETFKVIHKKNSKENGDGVSTKANNVLDLFGNNLTDKMFQQKIDPVIGRDEEIDRIIQILSRRTKNNPILLGEPGVGKTAIIEGLAKKIMLGEVPETLKNKKIYSVDLTTTVAGTMYRGEFENRIKQIIDEVKGRSDIILFIDEIHNIVGAGSASGSMDAANILKPALARGEIHCIGATTYSDYRKSIESDTALERRFQAVKVDEPTGEEAKDILRGIKKYFENFHNVEITEDAIESAVNLSQKYLPEKFLPDKAIDLIDEAAAGIKVGKKISITEKKLNTLKANLNDLNIKKRQAIENENFDTAIKFKKKYQKLEIEYGQVEKKQQLLSQKKIGKIDQDNIAKIITRMTGIPVESLLSSEKKKILKLENMLTKNIIGQTKAVSEIASYIKRAKAGLTAHNKPVASFMFVGASGIGKTHTAKVIAKTIFGDDKALIKIDMSEYSEKFNVSKLIGAPAGYVGYKESGQLTEKVKHKPYSVILFDEVEKAHHEIFDLLLQVLDDGYLTDASGTKINFRNTIIILTSNIGSSHLPTDQGMGFDLNQQPANNSGAKEKIIKEVKGHFKVEFLNRLDKIVYFKSLDQKDLEKIVKLELDKLTQQVADSKITLTYHPELIELIAQKSHASNEGARAIGKVIQNMVEAPLADKILADEITAGDIVHISLKNGIINIVKQ